MTTHLDIALDCAKSVMEDFNKNPMIGFRHLPGPNGIRPGPQEQFEESRNKIKVLCGGNRSGKSTCGAHYFLKKALNTPNGRGWCVCPSWQLSVEIQQRKIWEMLPKDRIKYAKFDSINGFTNAKVILDNDFCFLFKAYEQGVEKFQSDDIDLIWDDEEPPYEIYKQQLMRTLDRGGEVFVTMTPISGYTRFVNEVLMKKGSITGSSVAVFYISTLDNYTLDENQLNIIMDTISDDADKPTLLNGVPVNRCGLVYPMWKDQYPWVQPVEEWLKVKDQTTRFTAIDPHNRTPTAVAFYGIDREGRIWCFDEIWSRQLIPDLAKEIILREAEAPSEMRMIDTSGNNQDSDGKTVRSQLWEHGVSTVLARKDHKNQSSIALMKQYLTMRKGDKSPRFMVVENCVRMRYEFQRYSWSDYSSDKMTEARGDRQEVSKKDDHFMDCNHYLIRSFATFEGDDRSKKENSAIEPEPMGAYDYVKREKEIRQSLATAGVFNLYRS